MDFKEITYLPNWAKALTLLVLGFAVLAGGGLAVYAITKSQAAYLSAALTFTQFSAYGLAAAIVILFAERELTVSRLLKRLDVFYSQELLNGLKAIRYAVPGDPDGRPISVEKINQDGRPGAYYELRHEGSSMLVHVSLNVRQLLVVYFFPIRDVAAVRDKDFDALETLAANYETHFNVTVDGARKIGWNVSPHVLVREVFDVSPYFELICRMKTADNFLLSSPDRLYWITDMAIMSRSALQAAQASGLFELKSTRNPESRLPA